MFPSFSINPVSCLIQSFSPCSLFPFPLFSRFQISARHLALASQSLGLVTALLPTLRVAFSSILPPKQHPLLEKLDGMGSLLASHRRDIAAKLVAIVEERIEITIRKFTKTLSLHIQQSMVRRWSHSFHSLHSLIHFFNAGTFFSLQLFRPSPSPFSSLVSFYLSVLSLASILSFAVFRFFLLCLL